MFLLLLFFAFSFPELGSKAEYIYSDGIKTAELILELSEYNQTKDQFLMKVTLEGKVQEVSWLKRSDFWSLKRFSKYYETCYKEEITVPAGTFKACRVNAGEKIMWFAPIPFLLVKEKVREEDGRIVTRDLVQYH